MRKLILKVPEPSRYFSRDALVLFPLPEVNNDGGFLQNVEDVKKLHITSSFSWLRWLWMKTSATWQTFISGLFKDTLISIRTTAITECWSRVGESVFSFCLSMSLYYNWAAAWDFQQFDNSTSVDSDEPLQPPFKLRNSKWCSVSSLTIIECSSDKQRLWSDCAYAQADLRLCWLHIPHCWKSHALAQLKNRACLYSF